VGSWDWESCTNSGRKRPERGLGLERLARVKVYVVEVVGTIVFIVFVCVEGIRAIRGLLEMLK
jgi:hypothetical protein